MNRTTCLLLLASAACTLCISCQPSSQTTCSPAKPLPSWVRSPATDTADRSPQQVRISTRLIQISRPPGDANIPTKRYEKSFSEDEFKTYIRDLSQTKGVELMTAPSIITRQGEPATLELIRECIHATRPGTDPGFRTENVGVTTHFLARASKDNRIDLRHFTRISEIDHFAETSPGFHQPVFNRRDVESSSIIPDGDTYLIGGIVDETAMPDEKHMDFINLKKLVSRELIIAITTTRINPCGEPLKPL